MIRTVWVGEENEVPESLDGSEEFDVVCLTEAESLRADADCVVCDSKTADAVGLLSRLRKEAPETPFVVVGSPEGGFGGETDAVFDSVPKKEGWEKVLADVVRNAVEGRTHKSYPVPEGEEDRIEVVRSYAEVSHEGAFDRLTEIGRRYFDVDMCFVGLVERDREVFLSCRGSSADDLSREQTVCTYQILDDDILVVEDIPNDPRFKNRETLLNLGMRFYAGASLVADSGERIGSFCIMDGETRSFDSTEERNTLSMFADEAMEKLSILREIE
jgi:hypothetical protein